MNRGYVHLWRKSLDAGWIKNHKLWAFWTYCLLKASWKEYDAMVGLQIVHLMPGQFIFGRLKASRETGLTEQEIRTVIGFLRKEGNLTIKTTNKFSIISVVNWHPYQCEEIESNQQSNQPLANKEPHTSIKALKEKSPRGISEKIHALKTRYPDQKIIDQALTAIQSTRRSNRITDSVTLGILQAWERYPIENVLSGISTYIEKAYAAQGKDEKYLLGIILRERPWKTAPSPKRSTGSSLLDQYYSEKEGTT